MNICQVDTSLAPRILLLLVFTELTETEAELEQSFTEGKTAKPVSGFIFISDPGYYVWIVIEVTAGIPVVGLQISAAFLHPAVGCPTMSISFKIAPPTRFTQQELKEGKLHVTELTDKWYQDIQASPLLSGDCNKFGKTLPF